MKSKDKPDLIICDPPYFDKNADEYAEKKNTWGCQPVCNDVFDEIERALKKSYK